MFLVSFLMLLNALQSNYFKLQLEKIVRKLNHLLFSILLSFMHILLCLTFSFNGLCCPVNQICSIPFIFLCFFCYCMFQIWVSLFWSHFPYFMKIIDHQIKKLRALNSIYNSKITVFNIPGSICMQIENSQYFQSSIVFMPSRNNCSA